MPSSFILMHLLHDAEERLDKRIAAFVPTTVKNLRRTLGDEVSETPNAVLEDIIVRLYADVLEDICVLSLEISASLELLQEIWWQPQDGICDGLEEEIVGLFRRTLQFVEQEVEDVVALLDVHLITVCEHPNHYS